MARQSNADKLSMYRRRVEASRNWRKNEQYDNLWQRMINLYRERLIVVVFLEIDF